MLSVRLPRMGQQTLGNLRTWPMRPDAQSARSFGATTEQTATSYRTASAADGADGSSSALGSSAPSLNSYYSAAPSTAAARAGIVLWCGLAGAIAEVLPVGIDDNLSMPVLSALLASPAWRWAEG